VYVSLLVSNPLYISEKTEGELSIQVMLAYKLTIQLNSSFPIPNHALCFFQPKFKPGHLQSYQCSIALQHVATHSQKRSTENSLKRHLLDVCR